GAGERESFTLEEMLQYALEDEHMALAEYRALMDHFHVTRPYANIARSEEVHISYLEEIYRDYGLEQPEISTENRVVIPETLLEAAQIGVQAEIDNIEMYQKFLRAGVPEDVQDLFEALIRGSENHLASFERQVDKYSSGNTGQGRNRS
ncbi:MAG: DUF2202 domain-containing protein, partial [Spirochaetales bacterium]|nr:DUF2202 domain-containing protein [Spirochaetales bacterium]